MKKILGLGLMATLASLPAYGADEKIDPETYICAELSARNVEGTPPIFESLQIDGYVSGKAKQPVADAYTLGAMTLEVSDSCAAAPTDKVAEHWQNARKNHPVDDSQIWRADKTTCAEYNDNPDDGSGFVIWLDGYWRGQSGKDTSILVDQQTIEKFEAACKANPSKLMLDVLAENAK